MTRDDFNTFCAALPATTHVVQWGNSDVWKVGGKVFAVCGWHSEPRSGPEGTAEPPGEVSRGERAEPTAAFTFKAGDIAFEVLKDEPGIRPAPYLASRGMKWLQVYAPEGMSDATLKEHLVASYDMAVARLTKKARAELGLVE